MGSILSHNNSNNGHNKAASKPPSSPRSGGDTHTSSTYRESSSQQGSTSNPLKASSPLHHRPAAGAATAASPKSKGMPCVSDGSTSTSGPAARDGEVPMGAVAARRTGTGMHAPPLRHSEALPTYTAPLTTVPAGRAGSSVVSPLLSPSSNTNAGGRQGPQRTGSGQPVTLPQYAAGSRRTSDLSILRDSQLSDIVVSSHMEGTVSMGSCSCSGSFPGGNGNPGGSGSGAPRGGYAGRGHGRPSFANNLFKGEDLEAQRQMAPLSIEEDLFIYDDIIISKDEARTKHWRLAGRKLPVVLESEGAAGGDGANRGRSNSTSGKNFFTFNDFDVCVDEMDLAISGSTAAAGVEALQLQQLQQSAEAGLLPPLSGEGSPTSGLGYSAVSVINETTRITNTVPRAPNTVARYLQDHASEVPASNRPLRGFDCHPVLGHATRVKCIALAPGETDYASCSNEDASMTLNSLSLGAEVGIFTGHQDTIINAAFSPDGKYLATTSKDKTMILWDVMTTKNLLTFTHSKVVICCCFSPDSKYVVSGCQDRVCRLWDTKRGKEWLSYNGHEGIIISIAYSPCGGYICSASADKSMRVWSSTTAKTKLHLTGHVGIILSCSYTTDGAHIVSNDESLLRVWSTDDGTCVLSLCPADVAGSAQLFSRGPKLGWTLSCASPGGFTNYVLVACNNRFVYVLDVRTGEEVTSTFCKAPVYCLTSGSKEKMACGDSFGNIYILTLA